MSDKTAVIVGGVAAIGLLAVLYLKRQQQQVVYYANEPGLDSQPSLGAVANNGLANLLQSATGAFSNFIGNGFSSQGSGYSNEPGLEGDSYYSGSDVYGSSDYNGDNLNRNFFGGSSDASSGADVFGSDASSGADLFDY